MQTTYQTEMQAAMAGMLAISPDKCAVDSKIAEAAIAIATPAQIGSSDKQVVPTTDAIYGVAALTYTVEMDEDGTTEYKQYKQVSVLRTGRIWVNVAVAVAIDDPAYFDVTAQKFTNVSTDNIAVAGGKFVSSTAAAGLAILEIR